MLPKVFKTAKAQQEFFEADASMRSIGEPYIRPVEWREFIRSLVDHGGRAALRHDWKRSQQAFELAVDACLIVVRLTPPETINIGTVNGKSMSMPGAAFLYRSLGVVPVSVFFMQEALKPVASVSEADAACLKPLTRELSSIRNMVASYSRRHMALLESEQGRSDKAIALNKAQQADLDKALQDLRTVIFTSIRCVEQANKVRN